MSDPMTEEEMRAENEAIGRYQAAQSQRMADFNWHAVCKGEAWAREWLRQQPPIEYVAP